MCVLALGAGVAASVEQKSPGGSGLDEADYLAEAALMAAFIVIEYLLFSSIALSVWVGSTAGDYDPALAEKKNKKKPKCSALVPGKIITSIILKGVMQVSGTSPSWLEKGICNYWLMQATAVTRPWPTHTAALVRGPSPTPSSDSVQQVQF